MEFDKWTYRGNHSFYDSKLKTLAVDQLPAEKWSYSGKSDYGVLRNYVAYTFEKLWNEREESIEKQAYIYMDDNFACFNTGLYDKSWQSIYYLCVPNRRPGHQPWEFKSFYNSYTIKYEAIPQEAVRQLRRANYFSEPSQLIFDVKLSIVPQWSHILHESENFLRIPEHIRNNGPDFCQNLIAGAIESVRKRIEANYKTVVPQWYRGRIQLLAPLYLTNQEKPDLALVLSLSEDKSQYFAHTCITMEMAYNNARLIARPESYWLQP